MFVLVHCPRSHPEAHGKISTWCSPHHVLHAHMLFPEKTHTQFLWRRQPCTIRGTLGPVARPEVPPPAATYIPQTKHPTASPTHPLCFSAKTVMGFHSFSLKRTSVCFSCWEEHVSWGIPPSDMKKGGDCALALSKLYLCIPVCISECVGYLSVL